MKYRYFDDYSEGAHPEILKYISEHNLDQQLGYSKDEYCALAAERIKRSFNAPKADIHFLPNGTNANVIGLIAMLKDYEGVIAPTTGHIHVHEAGALEAAGHKILAVESNNGKLTVSHVEEALARHQDEHTVMPRVVFLTQATELGTAYTFDELVTLIEYAKRQGLYTYLDGARLSTAVANEALLKLPIDKVGSLGLDMFYIGGTKNGGLYGEAIVIQNDSLKTNFRYFMKQRGALMAKGRFMGLQFARFFAEDNLWLTLGKQANTHTKHLYDELVKLGIEFESPFVTNQIFPIFDNRLLEQLQKDYGFYTWGSVSDTKTRTRLVCSWATPDNVIDEFISDVTRILSNAHLKTALAAQDLG